ncbi:MAG: Tim44 domain-containing protein [Alphaproteobacteria bacterium]|nr:Tim44 domain-containing protein [Alphaproteobacteria bacterium]
MDFQFIDIVFFAMVALFLVLRLRAVLGKRTGTERRHPDPYAGAQPLPGRKDGDNVVALPERGGERPELSAPDPLATGLAEIRAADRGFNEQQFAAGARAAFEMILGAYAAGDTKALRPLLNDEVHGNFAREIDRRRQAGEKLDNQIVRMRAADIVEARMDGRNALVTVKFTTDQINVLRGPQGAPLEGQSTAPHEVIDLWTFARDTRSGDPNWLLVATGSAH